jgi:hypothetical protein
VVNPEQRRTQGHASITEWRRICGANNHVQVPLLSATFLPRAVGTGKNACPAPRSTHYLKVEADKEDMFRVQ